MISVELEREDKLTIAQWQEFLALARRSGAGDDTPVAEVMHEGTDVLCAYRVQVTSPHGAAEPERVSLPTWLVHDLLSVVSKVAKSDGDVRGLEEGARTALQRAYDHMLEPVLGENPYADQDKSESESS